MARTTTSPELRPTRTSTVTPWARRISSVSRRIARCRSIAA